MTIITLPLTEDQAVANVLEAHKEPRLQWKLRDVALSLSTHCSRSETMICIDDSL